MTRGGARRERDLGGPVVCGLRSPKFVRMFRGMNANELVSPKFQHVTIPFPPGQEARVRSFYVGALGLREKPIPRVVKPLGWIWFDTGSSRVDRPWAHT